MRIWLIVCMGLLAGCESIPSNETRWSVGVGYSAHSQDIGEEMESTHIAAAVHHKGIDSYLFRNSFGDPALAVGKRFTKQIIDGPLVVEGEAYLSLVTGYDDKLKYRYNDSISPFGWVGVNTYLNAHRNVSLELKTNGDFRVIGISKRF